MSNKDYKKLYLVTDYRIPFNELLEKTKEALIGGVSIVQYRAKNKETKEMCKEARALKKLCDEFGALFLVNDRIDVALAVKAHGVHIGQDDMDVSIAREIMPKDAIIGVTVHNKEEALKAIKDGADNLGVGALFSTNSKDDATLMTLETLREIKSVSNIPLYGIGGITPYNLNKDILENLDGVAVISALLNSDNIREKSKEFLNILSK
ncbi:thiamine phosphate synthase [Clostridium perfringens]|uniref:Thiamine-phosphate synthase n=1 Tax=Clostridium perfringens (strain SM101 / Type A) TaxID=289380 RepID=THIE_CLOPS|nr:thiamine phosphate synthase [Clostridium perfringens]Q0STA1.1 RecName: Full=Thiamine-phosphate synthase; Short=TP synthase; Short=TPS; AltName: Full=Thiamine-phosphate pyrophosphorylase; Short=TMP pyrophosphorylase; Short=TMP-PPase [Clostridium perfringens SM101]ABG85325.1 thiamine-phosphate diphosphorylase [Clostridium perfringens SM101]MBP2861297.1 thiamine phosphate synthase [Clostridium perfringens]MDH5060600.1 Thiamine-phosphate synthase [Clostridium perfringens NCTC 8239]UBK59566.1 th